MMFAGDIDGRPMISPEPDVLSFELDNSEYLLLLSCDGVWDSLSEQVVYSYVAQFVSKNSQESKLCIHFQISSGSSRSSIHFNINNVFRQQILPN